MGPASSKSALQAERQCENHGGSLIVVENETQNADLTAMIALGSHDVMPLGCRNNKSHLWRCLEKSVSDVYWFNETSNAGYWGKK